MNVLARVMRAAWDEATKPESYVRGDEFERFIREKLFPKESYELLHKTPNYIENNHDFIESSKAPDFRLRAKSNGIEFYVEAKFRSKYNNGSLEWCKPLQLKRYQEIDRTSPVLIAIGMGGHPHTPEKVFLIPVQHIKFIKLYASFLQRYETAVHHSVSPVYVRSLIQ